MMRENDIGREPLGREQSTKDERAPQPHSHVSREAAPPRSPDDNSNGHRPPVDDRDPLREYFREIGRIPLLTAAQEIELGKTILEGERRLRRMWKAGKQQTQKFRDLQVTVEDARDHFAQANLRLVVSVAIRYLDHGLSFLDLIQEGNLGLLYAVGRYDYRRSKFSTYATWWIRQSITRAIADKAYGIRIPVHQTENLSKLRRLAGQLAQTHGRYFSPEQALLIQQKELQADNSVKQGAHRRKRRSVADAIRATNISSLDQPLGDDPDSLTLGELVEDTALTPQQITIRKLLGEELREILESLPVREAKVLELRFGLKDGQTYTLEAVGEELGLTRERIRQIERDAYNKLRTPAIKNRLKDYLKD